MEEDFPKRTLSGKVEGHEMPGKHGKTRLELGPKAAVIFTRGLELFFVETIMREYLEGPFSKWRARFFKIEFLHKICRHFAGISRSFSETVTI